MDGSRIRKEKVAFSNQNGYLWTGPDRVSRNRSIYENDTTIHQTALSQNTVIHHKITSWKLIADNDNCPCLKTLTQNHFNFDITDDRI